MSSVFCFVIITLVANVAAQETRDQGHSSNADDLVSSLLAQNTRLVHQVTEASDAITEIRVRVSSLEQRNNQLMQTNQDLQQQITDNNQRITGNEVAIGFTAYGGNRQYSSGDVVIFDNDVSNLGGHYHIRNSTFTCPYAGTYLFSVNVLSARGYSMAVRIVKGLNAVLLVDALADELTDRYNHGSAFVITPCAAGEIVWSRAEGHGFMVGSVSLRHSHFSGFLLKRDN